MFSFAIIVFREVLEIALVLSILIAGTRGVPKRELWIWFGILLGIAGSVAVAFTTERISQLLEGFGQEVFNASVLIIAASLIGFTVVWMKRQAREIASHMREVGTKVACGARPLSVLTIVIALTFLRDGSEVVLLAQGVLASSQSANQLILGGMLGLTAGSIVGAALYFGILKAATRRIFAVTSGLLIILCAGMVSQGVALLAAADILPMLAGPLWDTSHLISDHSFFGQTFHIIFGYTSKPSGMQVICYVLTIMLVVLAMRRFGTAATAPRFSSTPSLGVVVNSCALLLSLGFVLPAQAIDKIYSPIVEEGELELETRGTYSFDSQDEKDGAYKQLFGVGYGFTDRFAAEMYGEIVDEPGEELDFEAVLAEVRYQLFDQGEYWLDAGLYFEYAFETESEEHEAEAKLLLEKSMTDWVHTANFVLEREVFGSGGEDWEGAIRWHTLYRFSEFLEPGIEIHSEIEDLDHPGSFDEQGHYIGPALHGHITTPIGYELAGLFGVSDEAAAFTLRWVLEYEF